MTSDRPGSPQGVPTLTEVLAIPEPARDPAPRRESGDPVPSASPVAPREEPPLSVDALTERILADVQAQVEQLLEYRLREVLAPILTRASDALVRDARTELSRSLRDIVTRSVAQELLRQRTRSSPR